MSPDFCTALPALWTGFKLVSDPADMASGAGWIGLIIVLHSSPAILGSPHLEAAFLAEIFRNPSLGSPHLEAVFLGEIFMKPSYKERSV